MYALCRKIKDGQFLWHFCGHTRSLIWHWLKTEVGIRSTTHLFFFSPHIQSNQTLMLRRICVTMVAKLSLRKYLHKLHIILLPWKLLNVIRVYLLKPCWNRILSTVTKHCGWAALFSDYKWCLSWSQSRSVVSIRDSGSAAVTAKSSGFVLIVWQVRCENTQSPFSFYGEYDGIVFFMVLRAGCHSVFLSELTLLIQWSLT